MSKSDEGAHAELLARHAKVMPSWLSLYYEEPIELVSGQGRHVTDAEGRTYLDFFGGILTTMTGHAVPEVVDAIRTQAGRMVHTSTLYLIRPMVELAERIAGLSAIPDAKVFLVNSGTEANDTALQLTCTARQSNQVLALRNSYHGRSFASMAITGIRSWSSSSLTPVDVHYVHGGYRYRSPFGHLPDEEFARAAADDLRDILETATAGDVACLIAEPIQGVGGFITPPDGFFAPMKAVADEYGVLWVSDEVQTGWGRTGEHFWGYQAHGITPDLLTFAKGIGNGLAIGGVVGRGELIDSVHANSISTFGGNPLATAGALANLEYLLSQDLQGNALARGRQLMDHLAPLVDKFPIVGEVRGKGLMIGIELVEAGSDGATPGRPAPAKAGAVLEAARDRGLLVGKGGIKGNVLRLAPPLSLTAEEADEGAAMLIDAIAAAS
ncbi:aspartate aminotransferase family protein [Acidiferrimicrobium sp. IK]|uniref:aspartate aminotransferase family protein n=1 Tax=Acidiferrimicrobium sp. IK TaxID=2871700 RepID=UPI0021CB1557|nr:aspartate aminotransferase family protein [Acidiferrimicrobium sp. IK]MCU4185825.1 aspartate aminotransferase family protein [Acidiferrimicrobium sp. IK]